MRTRTVERVSDMDRANRKLRRASAMLGFGATVSLIFYWTIGLALCAFGGYVLVQIIGTF
jgi:hypothetical protein